MADSQTPNIFEGQNQGNEDLSKKQETLNDKANPELINQASQITNASREVVNNIGPTQPAQQSQPEIMEIEIDAEEEKQVKSQTEQVPPNVVKENIAESLPINQTQEIPQDPINQTQNTAQAQQPTTQPTQQKPTELSPEQKLLAVIAYMSFLVFIPITQGKKDEYVDFHIRQGLTMAALDMVSLIFCGMFLRILPNILSILGSLLLFVVTFALIGVHCFFIIKAATGEKWMIPNIGEIKIGDAIQKINIDRLRTPQKTK